MASDRDIVGSQTQAAGEVNASSQTQTAGVSGRDVARGPVAPASLEASADCPLPVAERFVSVNGEGRAAGKLAAFIRFTGCNLACSYCDTMWANAPAAADRAERVSVADLVAWARETRVECITLTGGEPVLQPELPRLVRALLAEPGPLGRGLRVEIETNGAADLCELTRLREECASRPGSLTFTVDWKLPASGMEDRMLREGTDDLSLLGNQGVRYPQTYDPSVLETFENKHPGNDYFVKFNCPEFTSLCPITGQPDFATIYIAYVPGERMVESKSLKLYLFSFRNHGDFHEDCVNIIMKDLIKLMDPKYIEVWGKFLPRGGISIDPYCNYGKPGTRWEDVAWERLSHHDLYPEKVDNR